MIVNIQALRALAALLVVCVHMAAFGTLLGWRPRATAFGNCGVDLFFVISGFIMMHTVTGRATTGRGFLLNRIVRVVPLYWLTTLAVFALALAVPSLLGDTRADWRALAFSLVFIPFDRGGGSVEPLFFLGWTLNYEMFFYACFALALWLARGRPQATLAICAAMIAACVVVGWLATPVGVIAQFYTNDLMLEFVFGIVVAWIVAKPAWPSAGIALAMVGLGLVFMIAVGPAIHAPRWAVSGSAASVVVLGAVWAERRGVRAAAWPIQALGAASYALYLTHPFVMQAFGKVAARIGGGEAIVIVAAGVGLGAAVAVSLVVHRLIELPVTERLRRAIGHRRPIVEQADPLAEKGRDNLASAR